MSSGIDTGPEEAGMGERQAVEVLDEAFNDALAAGFAVAALLAAVGGGPVVILEDGTLRGLVKTGCWSCLVHGHARKGNRCCERASLNHRLTVPGDPPEERER